MKAWLAFQVWVPRDMTFLDARVCNALHSMDVKLHCNKNNDKSHSVSLVFLK